MSRLKAFIVAVALCGQCVALSAQGSSTVTVVTTAPIVLGPDGDQAPVLLAKVGSILGLVGIEGDWFRIEFRDPQVGNRIGYVQKRYVKENTPQSLAAVDASVANPSSLPSPSNPVRRAAAEVRPVWGERDRNPAVSLRDVHRIYIEEMPNDLHQYLSAEVSKQFKGRMLVVLQPQDADAILRGASEKKDGVGAAITGRYLGLHDNATGSVSLVDRDATVVLWSAEAGDRSLMWGVMARGGPRKVASRLIGNLKKAIEKAP